MKTEVFCSFCSLPHKVYTKTHIGVSELLAFSAISVVGSYAIWQDFHWAGVVVFAALMVWAELMFRFRWRQSVKCKSCGFDPYIYKKDPEAAAKLVKEFLENRHDNAAYLLRPRVQLKAIAKPVAKDLDKPVARRRPRDLDLSV